MLHRPRVTKWMLFCCGALTLPFVGGCELLEVPPEVTPAPTPTPPPDVPIFSPAEGSTPGAPLNGANDPAKPEFYRAVRIDLEADGAPILSLQSVDAAPVAPNATPRPTATPAPGSTPVPRYVLGARPDPVRMAGIVLPMQEPYRTAALQTLQNWAASPSLDVEQDKAYPFDLQGRARVQLFFTGRNGTTKGQRLNLNRLMVRSGYAIVDLFSPTTFDTQVWLNDEQVARTRRFGLWRDPFFRPARRLPAPTPTPKGTPGATTTTTTTTATTTTTSATPVPTP